MRIGLIAPPWVPVPPTGYGGTEAVVPAPAPGHRVDRSVSGRTAYADRATRPYRHTPVEMKDRAVDASRAREDG